MKMLVTSAKYDYDPGNRNIITYYGRLENGSKGQHSFVAPPPYFYVQTTEDQAQIHGIDGTPLKKIVVNTPMEVTKERDKYQKIWEADIPYVERVSYDIGLKKYIELDTLTPTDGKFLPRMCKLDIEVDPSHGFPLPEEAKEEIFSITFYDTYLKKYFILTTKPPITTTLVEMIGHLNFEVRDFVDEKAMLFSFYNYLTSPQSSPDVLSGYNITGFDYPYLYNRMKKFGYNINSWEYVVFDDEYAYIRMRENQIESYTLNFVSQLELGEHKVEYKGNLAQLRKNNIEKFLYYNYKDVELIVRLDQKLGLFQTFFQLSQEAGTLDMSRYNAAYIIDALLLHYGKGKFALPTVLDKSEKKKVLGAIVLPPQYGMFDNVVVFDFKSMYPSLLRRFNISPDTLDSNGNINIDDVRFTNKKIGIFPTIITNLLNERYNIKKLMKTVTDLEEYRGLDYRQRVMKELTNAFYGVLGSPHYRLHNDDIQGAITYAARSLISYVVQLLSNMGYQVLYGDTDSVFWLQKGGETIQQLHELSSNIDLDSYTQMFGVPSNDGVINLEFEAILDKWFQPGVKKKYYGRYIWKDGQTIDPSLNEMKIRGFEARRSNTSFYTKTKQKQLMIISFQGRNAVNQWVKQEESKWHNHTIDINDIALNTSVKRDLDYKTNTQVLKAIENSKKEGIDVDVKLGKVKIYFINDTSHSLSGTKEIAIGFDDQLPQKYVKMIDWEEHKRRCFDLPMKEIVEYFKSKPIDSWIVSK